MNERIRELAEQALFESNFDDEQNIKITMDIFAESIVRECVKKSVEICMNRIQGDCWKNNQADIEALRCSQDIQRELPKHFGVLE